MNGLSDSNASICVIAALSSVLAIGCSDPKKQRPADPMVGATTGDVVFTGGMDISEIDQGRPVVLIGNALGVSPEVFRDAFSGVTPSKMGPPSPSHAKANKKVLMDKLAPHGITNDRLDEVSNYYRYNRSRGEIWTHTPATAKATISDGVVTSIEMIEPGSGYTSAPKAAVIGYEDTQIDVTIGFSTQLDQNGRITSANLRPQS